MSPKATQVCDSRGGGGEPLTTGRSHAIWLDKGLSSRVYRSFRYLAKFRGGIEPKSKERKILRG